MSDQIDTNIYSVGSCDAHQAEQHFHKSSEILTVIPKELLEIVLRF